MKKATRVIDTRTVSGKARARSGDERLVLARAELQGQETTVVLLIDPVNAGHGGA